MDMLSSTRPLDLVSDFPAIPEGWAYLDTAATAQKPKPVIDAITRGYAATYATVHRGVYQRSSDMTLAFDDFGSGSSRIAELIEVRPQFLKFDRTMIRNLDEWREHLVARLCLPRQPPLPESRLWCR